MASLKPVVKLQKAWNAAGAPGFMPPRYVKREVIKGTLAPIGRFGSPLPTRTNVSTLHLYGAGLAPFAAWQVGPTSGLWGVQACVAARCPRAPMSAHCTCSGRGSPPSRPGRCGPLQGCGVGYTSSLWGAQTCRAARCPRAHNAQHAAPVRRRACFRHGLAGGARFRVVGWGPLQGCGVLRHV